jgi:integrase/recombinase XerC
VKNLKTSYKKLITDKKLQFLDEMANIKGYSDLTLKTYDTALNEALNMIEIEEHNDTLILNLMPYRLHIASLHAKTISKKLSAVRSFVDFLNECGIKVILKNDDSIKVPKTLPKPISHEHIKEALKKADFNEKFIIIMLYTLGLRISELSDIKLKDISKGWIRIKGKGNKQRDIPILESTQELIESFLEKNMPKNYLFEKNGEKLSQNSLRYIIDKTFKKVGLKVTPHQLRHSFATSLLNQGANIADVSELLGHSSMATTQIYTKLASSLKEENYLKSHPLAMEN